MRLIHKGNKLLAMLLAAAVSACLFPAVYAEEPDAEIIAADVTMVTSEEQNNVTEPDPMEVPAEEQNSEPVAEPIQEPAVEPIPEPVEEPAPEPIPEPAEEPAPEPIPEPAEEPAQEPIPEPAEEPAQEPIPEPAEEPAAEPIPEPAEEPAQEPSEEPAEEPVPAPAEDPAEEPAPVPIEGEITPEPDVQWDPYEDAEEEEEPEDEEFGPEDDGQELFEFDDDDAGYVDEELLEQFNNPDTYEQVEFCGTADIELKQDSFAYGDTVTLVARVRGVEISYRMIWEANDNDSRGWYAIASGTEYSFTVTPEIMNREYRVVLFTVD